MRDVVGKLRFGAIILVGAVFLGIGFNRKAQENQKPIDVLDPEFNFEDLKDGDHVVIDGHFIMDNPVVYKKDGIEKSKIYCLPHLSVDDEDLVYMDGFIGVTAATDSDKDAMDKAADISCKWWNGEVTDEAIMNNEVEFDGIVRKMTNDEISLFERYIKETGRDASMLTPYKVEKINGQGNLILGLGGVITLAGIVCLVGAFVSDSKEKKLRKESQSIPGYEDAL